MFSFNTQQPAAAPQNNTPALATNSQSSISFNKLPVTQPAVAPLLPTPNLAQIQQFAKNQIPAPSVTLTPPTQTEPVQLASAALQQ